MGKKLTEKQILEMIKARPNNQMFDCCCLCDGVESAREMNSVQDPDSFDLICDECQKMCAEPNTNVSLD